MPEIFSNYLHNAKNAFPVQALRNFVYAILPEQDKEVDATGTVITQRLVTICGRSGSGKTMLLSAIAEHLGQSHAIFFAKAANWLDRQDDQENESGQNRQQARPENGQGWLAGQKMQVLLLDDLQDISAPADSWIALSPDFAPDVRGQGKSGKKNGWQDVPKISDRIISPAASRLCAILDSLDHCNGSRPGQPAADPGQNARQPGNPDLVILAFCGPAAGLASLGQRLQTRICQGLVLELHDPDLDVRLKFAENFAKKQKIALERSQLVQVARYCGNIPAVAGVLTRIRAYLEAGFNIADQTSLEKLVQNGGQAVMPGCRDIVHEVARLTDTRPAEIIGRSRKAEVVLARQLAMLVCRRLLGLSYMELGREFGGRDHSTVMHAIEKFNRAALGDKRMNNLVTEVESSLRLRTENLASRLSMFVA